MPGEITLWVRDPHRILVNSLISPLRLILVDSTAEATKAWRADWVSSLGADEAGKAAYTEKIKTFYYPAIEAMYERTDKGTYFSLALPSAELTLVGTYLTGDKPSLADFLVATQIRDDRLGEHKVDLSAFPRIESATKNLFQIDSIKTYIATVGGDFL